MASKRRKGERKRDPIEAALEEASARRGAALEALDALDALDALGALGGVTDAEAISRAMARRYVLEGDSLAAVARDFGVTPETVRARIMGLGLPIRPSPFREPSHYREKARALHLRAAALGFVADCLEGFTVPPRELLARTTGGE